MHDKGEILMEEHKQSYKKLHSVQSAYIDDLQKAVQKFPKFTEDFKKSVDLANKKLSDGLVKLGQPRVNFKINLEKASTKGESSVRITHPTKTVVSATVLPEEPFYVEFYQTRPRADGIAETSFLGLTKYADRDGKRKISFLSERFARKPNDPLIIHGELLDETGHLLAAHALAAIV